jgi:outer membrane immunogenic protein
MKHIFFAAVGISAAIFAGSAGVAGAADMPLKAPPVAAPAWSWTGCYVGLNAGWSQEKTSGYNATPTTTLGVVGTVYPGTTERGAIGGFQAGCNYQVQQQWVVGLEGDWDAMGHSGSAVVINPAINPAAAATTEELWDATVRGRLGFIPAPKTLLYVTGGAAWMKISSTQIITTAPSASNNNQADTRLGWTIGGGLEYAVTNNVLLRAEYLYVKIPSYNTFTNGPFFGGPPVPLSVSLTQNIGRVGISYKFW